jgi:hypothetical protein
MWNVSKLEILSIKCFPKQIYLFRKFPILRKFVVLARAEVGSTDGVILTGEKPEYQ